jgi:DNA-binding CsgD family transcriptional regulator
MTVLARVHVRHGQADATRLLAEALRIALPTGEVQRIAPVVTAMAEAAWLRGDRQACLDALRHLERLPGEGVNAWEAGEVAVWRRRAGQTTQAPPPHAAAPWRLELEGDPLAAAQAWLGLGAPNEAALALLQAALSGPRDSAPKALAQALEIAERIGARVAAARVRALAHEWGLEGALPGRQRSPRLRPHYSPHGLSGRELQVLEHLQQGLSNADIASQLGVALRTAEHHVAGVLKKLSATDRADAAVIARAQGLLQVPRL